MNILEKLEDKRIFRLIVTVICVALSCTMLFQILSKRNYIFYDEMMSYYRSTLITNPGEGIDWEHPDGIINTIVTGEDFTKTIIVDENSKILGNVGLVDCIKIILTERQYNVLLNFVSGARNAGFSFLDSIILNMILLAFCLFLMYRIVREMCGEWKYGLLAIALTTFSPGVTLVAGYMRFYIFYCLCMLLLTYSYLRLSKIKNSIWKQIPYIILILATTWFGYNNAEYTLIFAAMMCIMYLITCIMGLEKSKFFVCFIPHALCVVGFIALKFNYILYQLNNADSTGVGMSQVKVAFDNLANRSSILFKIYLKTFFGESAFYSINLFIWLLLLAAFIVCLFLKRKTIDFFDFRNWYVISVSTLVYILIVSRIAPWDVWRYISPMFFMVIIIFIGIFQLLNIKPMFKNFLGLILIAVAIISYAISIPEIISMELDGDGPTEANREYMQESFANMDSIYFYDGDAGTMFYGAFLWPKDGKVYFTTPTDFRINTPEKAQMLEDDSLLVWMSRNDDVLERRVKFLMSVNGYTCTECVMDTGVEGRHRIYLFER